MNIGGKRKIGNVWLRYDGSGHYECYFYDEKTRNPVRRRFNASTFKDALQVAKNFDRERLRDKGLLPSSRKSKGRGGHSIKDALIEFINHSKANRETGRDYKNSSNLFLKWIEKQYPYIRFWGEIKPFHLEQYVSYMQKEGKAFDTVRRRFYAVRGTSLYMSENYWETQRDIAKGIKIEKPAIPGKIKTLSSKDVAFLLSYSEKQEPGLFPVLQLQALCGLRIKEAVYLRECDINQLEGTITITETPGHKPKNRASYRTIPVPGLVMKTLIKVIRSRSIQGKETPLFPSGRQKGGQVWSLSGISHALRRVFDGAYRKSKNEEYLTFQSRRLRACFATLAGKIGIDNKYLRPYLGHAPTGILEERYQAISMEELRSQVVGKMETFFLNKGIPKVSKICR